MDEIIISLLTLFVLLGIAGTIAELRLLSSGKYQLRVESIRETSEDMIYAIIGACAVLILCSIIYIVIKKKYWFW